jgi:hypothetical protein
MKLILFYETISISLYLSYVMSTYLIRMELLQNSHLD